MEFENIEMSPQQERQEKYGCNVTTRMIIMRHGEKMGEVGELSTEGKQKLLQGFSDFEFAKDRVKLSSTNVSRNVQTLQVLEEIVGKDKLGTSYIDTALVYSPERFGGKMHEGQTPDISDEFAEKLLEVAKEKGKNQVNQFLLDFKQEKPDGKTLSPLEIASRFAKRLLFQTKVAKRLYSNSEVDFIQISGTPLVFALLQELAMEQIQSNPVNEQGVNFTEKLGGELDFGEAIILEEHTDNEGNLAPIKVLFRGKTYTIPIERLEKLANQTSLKPRRFRL